MGEMQTIYAEFVLELIFFRFKISVLLSLAIRIGMPNGENNRRF